MLDLIYSYGFQGIYVTSKGKIYVWGKNEYGQLRFPKNSDGIPIRLPSLFKLPENFQNKLVPIKASGSCFHSLFLIDTFLYSRGWNQHGQLGRENLHDKLYIVSISQTHKITSISSGRHFSTCLTEEGNCFVWGYNEHGELGLGDFKNRFTPNLLELPESRKFGSIYCGEYHSFCLSKDGMCFAWGWNSYGQLGLHHNLNVLTPTFFTLPNKDKPICFSCGRHFSICMTWNGEVYTCGLNASGELGLGDKSEFFTTPTLLKLPNNESVFYISCGGSSAACLTEKNRCYVWGNNLQGQLGLGHMTNCLYPTLFEIGNEKISCILFGEYHGMCLTENNLCYIWGWNDYGQLGLGDKLPQSLNPTLLNTFPDIGLDSSSIFNLSFLKGKSSTNSIQSATSSIQFTTYSTENCAYFSTSMELKNKHLEKQIF